MNVRDRKQEIRERVWALLATTGSVVSDPHGRIPNFASAAAAAARLAVTSQWRAARVIKCNPDQAQEPVRAQTLRDGKQLYMAVPALTETRPFFHVNPILGNHAPEDAATSAVAAAHAPLVDLEAMGHIDLVVSGCTAVNGAGARLGKGAGYADIEMGLLVEAGLVDDATVLATTVHDLQVLDIVDLPEEPHDFRLDLIVTPSQVIACPRAQRPGGINWALLPPEKVAAIPALAARQPQAGS
ncbi:5-formyltetrahydrofolate cyclo-ligase [Glycomyces sp. A-F 0318]|uniref:5-formyltetrahydrofolate cyclo-ligase n=1 Tax=Glycomyces amatae TaxID=2881355 RepID=UPI001E3A8EA3|nr:5-formyltetrahydrofolate cyclo-ligase [Glycomyces amatae]MCD0446291.1 5-formyltetrahydrofolate cyclo-ligase [Glycomyces amatae]